MMTFRKLKNKIVFCSHGVYFALSRDEFEELKLLLADIESDDDQ